MFVAKDLDATISGIAFDCKELQVSSDATLVATRIPARL